MRFDKNALLEFLKARIADTNLQRQVLEDIRPHLMAAEHGRYAPLPEREINVKKLIAAVEQVTEWTVTDVATISMSDPFPQAGWQSPYAYELAKRSVIGTSFVARLRELPKNSVHDVALDSPDRTYLLDVIQRRLCKRLKEAAEASYRELLTKDVDMLLGQDLKYGGCELLFRYLCCAVAGEAGEAERFGRIVRKYAKSPILGLLKNGHHHRGSLLVLAA
jgi:hypothetical protein